MRIDEVNAYGWYTNPPVDPQGAAEREQLRRNLALRKVGLDPDLRQGTVLELATGPEVINAVTTESLSTIRQHSDDPDKMQLMSRTIAEYDSANNRFPETQPLTDYQKRPGTITQWAEKCLKGNGLI